MHSKSWKTRRLFLRYAGAYLAILLVCMIVGLLTCIVAYRKQREQTIDVYRSLMERNRSMIEQKFHEIQGTAQLIAMDTEIASFYKEMGRSERVAVNELIRLHNALPNYKVSNQSICELLIYDDRSGYIRSNECVGTDVELFCRTYLNYENMTPEEWRQRVADTKGYVVWPSMTVTGSKLSGDYITCVYETKIQCHTLYVIALVDSREIYQIYSSLNDGNDVWMILSDGSDRSLLSTLTASMDGSLSQMKDGEYVCINGENAIAIQTTADQSGFCHTLFLTPRMLSQSMELFVWIYLCGFLLLAVAGFAVAICVSSRRFDKLASIAEAETPESSNCKDIYGYLAGCFAAISDQNLQLAERIACQQPMLQIMFYDRLLRGLQAEEIKSMSENGGVLLPEGGGYVVVAQLLSADVTCMRPELIRSLTGAFPESLRIVVVNPNRFAVLMACSKKMYDESIMAVRRAALLVHHEMMSAYDCAVTFGAGAHRGDWSDLWQSYTEAEAALELCGNDQSIICVYSPHELSSECMIFDETMEKQLLTAIQHCDGERACRIIDGIFEDVRMTRYSARMVSFCMINAFLRMFDGQNKTNEYCAAVFRSAETHQCESSADYLCLVKEIACDVVRRIQSCLPVQDSKIDLILDFIRMHYADPALGLTMCGEAFEMSEKSFSRFFKEQTGSNFTDFVEQLRMKSAMDLLLNSDLKIKEIAGMVGYTSDNTFYKAFRRVYSISPSEVSTDRG